MSFNLYILDKMEEARDALNRLWYMNTFGYYVFGNDVDMIQRHKDRAACLVLEARLELEAIKYYNDQRIRNFKRLLLDYLNEAYTALENFWSKLDMSVVWNKCVIDNHRKYMFEKIADAKKDFLENGSKSLKPDL